LLIDQGELEDMSEQKENKIFLSPKFEEALILANRIHADQTRKDSGAPYLSHILGVTALVLEDGGTEEEAIAALLHDAAEDHGGEEMLSTIREKFGEKLEQIVRECSDTLEMPKPPWKGRKEQHLDELKTALPETIRVMLADKVYNARNLQRSLEKSGPQTWDNFKGGREGTLWYFRQMHTLLSQFCSGYMIDEFSRLIDLIEEYK
jgi:(p)ppGpp synthase/HD superfamily hydrolase